MLSDRFVFILLKGRDSLGEGQRKARKSDPSFQKKKLGHGRGIEYSKNIIAFSVKADTFVYTFKHKTWPSPFPKQTSVNCKSCNSAIVKSYALILWLH